MSKIKMHELQSIIDGFKLAKNHALKNNEEEIKKLLLRTWLNDKIKSTFNKKDQAAVTYVITHAVSHVIEQIKNNQLKSIPEIEHALNTSIDVLIRKLKRAHRDPNISKIKEYTGYKSVLPLDSLNRTPKPIDSKLLLMTGLGAVVFASSFLLLATPLAPLGCVGCAVGVLCMLPMALIILDHTIYAVLTSFNAILSAAMGERTYDLRPDLMQAAQTYMAAYKEEIKDMKSDDSLDGGVELK